MWKNWLIRKRHTVLMVAEIAVVLALFGALVALQNQLTMFSQASQGDPNAATTFPPVSTDEWVDRLRFVLMMQGRKVYFAPNSTKHFKEVLRSVRSLVNPAHAQLVMRRSEDEAMKDMRAAKLLGEPNEGLACVIFRQIDRRSVVYDLRFSDMHPYMPAILYEIGGSDNAQSEYHEMAMNMVIPLQHTVDAGIVKWAKSPSDMKSPRNSSSRIRRENPFLIPVKFQKFPIPKAAKKQPPDLSILLGLLLPLATLFCFMFLIPIMHLGIVKERESGVKELMKLMGLSSLMYWSSWYFSCLLVMIIPLLLMSFMVLTSFPIMGSMLNASDPTAAFFFFFVYTAAFISFTFLSTLAFDQVLKTIPLGLILAMASCMIPMLAFELWNPSSNKAGPNGSLALCLLPNVAMVFGYRIVHSLEARGKLLFLSRTGLQWKDFHRIADVKGKLSMSKVIAMLFFDAFLYFALTLYIDAVRPTKYGKSFWSKFRRASDKSSTIPEVTRTAAGQDSLPTDDPEQDITRPRRATASFEPEPTHLPKSVEILNLRKEYRGPFGKRIRLAVDNVSLNVFQGQITVLLGHNGAGKSTTMSIITGQKRKLSLAMALIGGSKIVVLDEPTSGMDPEARRHMWDYLLEEKDRRTIFLTTHFMEEADILGDRIAIMANGKIMCVGSPLFLKHKYASGLLLVILKQPQAPKDDIYDTIKTILPGAVMAPIRNPSELNFLLPLERRNTFPELLGIIESNKERLGIISFSISTASMEQVFLNVGEEAEMANPSTNISILSGTTSRGSDLINPGRDDEQAIEIAAETRKTYHHGKKLESDYTRAMIIKKFIYLRRQWPLFISQLLLPLLLCLTSLILDASLSDESGPTPEPATVSPDMYYPVQALVKRPPGAMFPNISSPRKKIGSDFESVLISAGGIVSPVPSEQTMEEAIEASAEKDLPKFRTEVIMAADFTTTALVGMFSAFAHHAASIVVNLMDNALSKVGGMMTTNLILWMENSTFVSGPQKTPGMSPEKPGNMSSKPLNKRSIFSAVSRLAYDLDDDVDKTDLDRVLEAASWPLRLIPSFSFCYGLQMWSEISYMNSRCESIPERWIKEVCDKPPVPQLAQLHACCPKCGTGDFPPCVEKISYFAWEHPSFAQELVSMIVVGAFYALLLFVGESSNKYKIFLSNKLRRSRAENDPEGKRFSSGESLDADVAAENARVFSIVEKSSFEENSLVAHNLTKVFSNSFMAVNNLSVAVKKGECFGLLGVNGAGKTTTFRMLTADEDKTSGKAFMNGFSLDSNRQEYLKQCGYCPQFDGLIDPMTSEETLRMYAQLRGIPKEDIQDEIDSLIRIFDLGKYRKKQSGTYSGGNKRKLSAAIAMVGKPSFIFLDEPTSGVDPVSRRKIWAAVSMATSREQSLMLTSHSMEECEALCDRLAIMVNGKFQCIGNPQYLKQRFCQGYSAQITLNAGIQQANPENTSELLALIKEHLPSMQIRDQHLGTIEFVILDPATTWKDIFATLEECHDKWPNLVDDYSIGETTLEQIFLSFARNQRPLTAKPKKPCVCNCCKSERKKSHGLDSSLPDNS
ncbi:unnamed protein product [Notodromas monacha]|uniref:ABC transporter domain-containing protein n=1 Tax=Notodromas monacha TaxID=399045 RepID=A0A7R9BJR1_9CRUS|nr:unnamed protein product [Notodromas monacha]CAG0915410.1 unnamed protein product [Notodromas monacha]